MVKILEKEQITVEKKRVEELEMKASILEEILSFLEDKYFGHLMEKAESEENIPLSRAKKILKK